MRILTKDPGRDFRVLNLTDPQLSDGEWAEGKKEHVLLEYTVNTLVKRCAPDLITVSGDLAWAGHYASYRRLTALLDGFGIPWAPVFGNHDCQGGAEALEKAEAILRTGKHCLYESGERALGFGNYTVGIEQDGRLIHGIILMDSHDRRDYTDAEGKTVRAWSDLWPAQFPWYRTQTEALAAAGAKESTLIMHIPIYNYREAAAAAFRQGLDLRAVDPRDGMQKDCFNPGYEDSFGVAYESIGSYPEDNGFFDLIKECGSTKTVLCGHDHVNDFSIGWQGVRLIYILKTGPGCYWDPRLNGGTLLTINASGAATAKHLFVDPAGAENN